PPLQQFLDLEEDAPAVLGRQHRPLAERRVRGADRALDVGAGTVRDLRDDRAVGGILHIEGGAAVGVHPLAVDVHPLDVGHGDPPCWRIGATSPREPTPAEDSMLDAARHSTWGPRNGPQAPNARKRPGTAVALLDFASTSTWGPRNGPQAPNARKRPGTAVALLDFASTSTWGPRNGPQAPNARKRPGTAVALLDDAAERLLVACATRIRLGVREVGDEPAGGAQELSVAVARADQLDAEG